jgi:hypothetical protein
MGDSTGGRMPDVILIGAMKTATSMLHKALNQISGLHMIDGERRFFSSDEKYEAGPGWYTALFAPHDRPGVLLAEGSNDYSFHARYPRAAERIARHVPHAKLIYSLRDPLDRIRSQYIQYRQQGTPVHEDFSTEIVRNPEPYTDQSDYMRQMGEYERHFDPARMVCVLQERFAGDLMEGAIRPIAAHLGLEPPASVAASRVNESKGKTVDGRLIVRLRRLPGYRALRLVLPGGLRRSIKETRLKGAIEELVLSDRAAEVLRRRLAEPTAACRERLGIGADVWKASSALFSS